MTSAVTSRARMHMFAEKRQSPAHSEVHNVPVTKISYIYMGWFISFGTNASVLSCNNVGRCHFCQRLLTCIPSLRAHDLGRHRHRSCTVVPVRWVVGSQRSRKTVAMFSKQEPPRIAGGVRCSCITIQNGSKMGCSLSRWVRTCGAHASIWSPTSKWWKCTAGVHVSRGGSEVTIRQLEQDTGLAHSTVLHILKDDANAREALLYHWRH